MFKTVDSLAQRLLTQKGWVCIPVFPEYFKMEKLMMLLKLINSAGKKKVDSGLKMLTKPI